MRIFYTSLILLNLICFADEDLEHVLNHNTYQPNYFSMLFGLAFVIALIYLTGIMYKKLTQIKIDNSPKDKYSIELVSATSLGQNKNLYVVKTDNKYSLIGATQNNISYLRDLGEEEIKDDTENEGE